MLVTVTESAEWIAECTGGLLRARPEHNVFATVLASLLDDGGGAGRHGAPLFGLVEDERGSAVGAVQRLPGRRLMSTVMSEAAVVALVDRWLEVDPDLPGVAGPALTARAFAAEWTRRTGRAARLEMAQALHTLERVVAPAIPAPGHLRPGTEAERELLLKWGDEFIRESRATGDARDTVGRRLDRGLIHVWDDGGPVSLVGTSQPIAGVVRIGPVYTPPGLRGRGYASSAVAACSQAALDAGAHQCLLYTDLANPTSNRIYAALGYRRVAEWEDLTFE